MPLSAPNFQEGPTYREFSRDLEWQRRLEAQDAECSRQIMEVEDAYILAHLNQYFREEEAKALEEASRPKVALCVTTSPWYPTRFDRI